MSTHMNRVLAEQYVTELRHVAEQQRMARDARRPGVTARLMTALRGNAAQNGRPAATAPAPEARQSIGTC